MEMDMASTSNDQSIDHRLRLLMQRTVALRDLHNNIHITIEEIHSLYPEYSRLKSLERNPDRSPEQIQKNKTDKNQVEFRLNNKFQTVTHERSTWYQEADRILQCVVTEQTIVVDHLNAWKRGQQLSGNGGMFKPDQIDQIQPWFEYLAQILWHVKLTIDYFISDVARMLTKETAYQDLVPSLLSTTQGLLYQLIRHSFVIEKQPPQVMKTSTRFSTTLRLLIGPNLGIVTDPPHIRASIVSEAYAAQLISKINLQENDIPAKDNCGTLVNNTATMEHNPQSRVLSANFRAMQLNKIKRTEKKGSESVMDEKFAIAFQAQIRVADIVFPVFALSLPVVAIVHGNQEPHAWATVTWDNAFAPPDRLPFIVPEKMCWERVGELLSMKFHQYVGKHLTPDALSFLAMKACRITNNNFGKDIKLSLSWSFFAKEPLPERGFTFWEWFYAILKVTQQHLSPLWREGAILGFVEKKLSEDMIARYPPGTYLLRFSDSELGGVSISFVTQCEETGTEVFMTSPFTSKDFAIRGLADRIHDLGTLTHLWTPTGLIPKDQKFAKHYSPPQPDRPTQNGYVKPQLACTLPGKMNNLSIGDSQPATPQSYVASSPESNAMSYVQDNNSQMGVGYGDYMNHQELLAAPDPTSIDQVLSQSQIDNLIDRDLLDSYLDEINIDYDDPIQMTP